MNKIPCGGFELDDSLVMENGKLGVAPGASVVVDSELSDTSTNPVQNKVIKSALDAKQDKNFTITFTKGIDNTYTANKTFDELNTAISEGVSISAVALDGSITYCLSLLEFNGDMMASFGQYMYNIEGGIDFLMLNFMAGGNINRMLLQVSVKS